MFHLLCVDEVGYLSYDSRCADLLFEVVTRRYEVQKPLLLSTNESGARSCSGARGGGGCDQLALVDAADEVRDLGGCRIVRDHHYGLAELGVQPLSRRRM